MLKIRFTDTRIYEMKKDAGGVLWAKGKCGFFGGPNDPMDSGRTASGFRTDKHPNDPYVAIPGPVRRKYKLPWGCRLTVENVRGEQVQGFLADTGPAKEVGKRGGEGRIGDLSHIFNVELGIVTDEVVKIYANPKIIDPRWKAGCD